MLPPPKPLKKSPKKAPLQPKTDRVTSQVLKKTEKSSKVRNNLKQSADKGTTLACPGSQTHESSPPKAPKKKRKLRTPRFKKALEEAKKAPQIGSKEWLKLRNEWYERLKGEGFKDLELTYKDKVETDVPLRGTSLRDIVDQYVPEDILYYHLWCNYSVHNRGRHTKTDNCIIEMYGNGKTYRDIMAHVNSQVPSMYPKRIWLWTIKQIVDKYRPLVMRWNETHPEGLLFQPDIEP